MRHIHSMGTTLMHNVDLKLVNVQKIKSSINDLTAEEMTPSTHFNCKAVKVS